MKIAASVLALFHKFRMTLSWAILNTPLKRLLFEVVEWQMRLQVSHLFKLLATERFGYTHHLVGLLLVVSIVDVWRLFTRY